MSEPVIIALITNATVIFVAVFSRWMSHIEHRETTKDVKAIKKAMNGAIKEKK